MPRSDDHVGLREAVASAPTGGDVRVDSRALHDLLEERDYYLRLHSNKIGKARKAGTLITLQGEAR